MNRPSVVNFNNGICAESVHRESNPNSQVYPDGGPQRSVRIHYIPVRPHISQKDYRRIPCVLRVKAYSSENACISVYYGFSPFQSLHHQ